MSRGFKRVLTVVMVLVVGLSAAFFLGLQMKLREFSKEIRSIDIQSIDLSKVADGEYTGEYYVNESVGAAVNVSVENHRITGIEFIEHKYGKGKKAEGITNNVIRAQSLQVDTISGATGSSTIILKAIENALLKAN
ncbi:FMN-binding domain-containing protein [Geosporobacter subterraneus DSM 17957]|uniref:FMN-binding domain-containing protein n=1 Tax=Geosporobacter subterraneus DSM 17957 TaxID=1121919 RepID=A0A1M6PB03_9FIRM|nr:FMN-binding protein [Geosporobacter subterraneus]SHK05123.1 FMN-binding domain-containing protein [Geosporobacter subterraneus DSM 17957]